MEAEDEPFLNTTSSDAEAYMNAAPHLPVPQGKKSSTRFREFLEKCQLSAIICLPPPANGTGANDDTNSKPIQIGVLHLSPPSPTMVHHRREEFGLNLIKQYRGQGYGSEAIQWVLHWCFNYAGLHKVGCGAFAFNTGAVRLYEKLGFVLEGRQREHLWWNGKFWDLVLFGMLEDEWRERYGKGDA